MRRPWNVWLILLTILTLSVALLMQTACDTEDAAAFEKRTAQALYANQKTWLDIQDLMARQKVAGQVTEAQWAQFEALDAKYRSTHNAAVTAFDEYKKLKDQTTMERVTQLIVDCGAIIAQAQELIRAWSHAPASIRSGPEDPGGLPATLRVCFRSERRPARPGFPREVRHVA